MLKIEKRKNENKGPEIGIKTNEGEFIISKENGNLYIGCFEKDIKVPIMRGNQVEFKITKEEEGIYNIFNDFFNGISLLDEEEISEKVFTSDDYAGYSTTSSLRIKKNTEEETISFIFKKSESDTEYDSYFIKFKDIDIPTEIHYIYLVELINELLIYSPTYGQITIDDLINNLSVVDEEYVRSRSNSRIN